MMRLYLCSTCLMFNEEKPAWWFEYEISFFLCFFLNVISHNKQLNIPRKSVYRVEELQDN